MPVSELKLIKRCIEFCEIAAIQHIPPKTRVIYVLFKRKKKFDSRTKKWKDKYDVVYIGMARGMKSGARGRLSSHRKSKEGEWTHFSIFEVWDNITEAEVVELEGLFRHIYRKDTKANPLNEQKGFKKLRTVGREKLENWNASR
jgi:hypothetical protein